MGQARRALLHWPPAWHTDTGDVRIVGRCLSMERWVRIHIAARLMVAAFGLFVMAVTTLEFWANGQGEMERVFWRVHHWIYQHELNWLEKALTYNKKPGELDLVLFLTGIVVFIGTKSFGSFLAGGIVLLGSGLIGNRFDITVSPNQVTLHRRWGRDLKLDRDKDNLQVRVVPPEEYYSKHSPSELQDRGFLTGRIHHPPAVVELVHCWRRYKVIMARREDEAEAIVVRCNEALVATHPTFSFPAL